MKNSASRGEIRARRAAKQPTTRELTTSSPATVGRMADYSDLKAIYINCTLKRSPDQSHTQGLADRSIEIMESNGVQVEAIRALDHSIATGVWPDMTEHGWERDDWP